MHKPCDNCPFRADKPPFPLGQSRRAGIAHSILHDGHFPCHKTTRGCFDEEGEYSWNDRVQPCIGAVLLVENELGDSRANLMFRFDVMAGRLKPDQLDHSIPTLNTYEAFVNYEQITAD